MTHPERLEGPGPLKVRQPAARHGANAGNDEETPMGYVPEIVEADPRRSATDEDPIPRPQPEGGLGTVQP